ncbi:hypothetical protein BJX76DRAFT_341291 [Aspergillus varians]
MIKIPSIDHKEVASSIQSKPSTFSKIKQRLSAIKKEWAPLLPAKESWDDEYNFPPGRWAGQGCDSR